MFSDEDKTYRILTGEEFDIDFLPRVMEVDAACYPDEYVGVLENMVARFQRNRRTFVCVMDGERLAGYINFFPVKDELWDEIVETGMEIRDDDIRPEEIPDYDRTGKNRLFIISIAIHPKYRMDKRVVIALTEGWIEYLNRLQAEGYAIDGISATAVSEDGKKFLRTRMFHLIREIHGGNCVYTCEGDYLKKLLEGELYFKSYRDDLYLLLPFAENSRNPFADKFFSMPGSRSADLPEKVKILMKALDDCLRYECSNSVTEELERRYLGEFAFLHTRDDYPEDENESPCIVGEEKMYLLALAHRPSHMYVVMIFIENSRYSSSQIEDQLFHGFLKIRGGKIPGVPEKEPGMDEYGRYQYEDFFRYLSREYGLLPCGAGKCMLCMSRKPASDGEFRSILAGEVFDSMHQDFHIDYPELNAQMLRNRAIYDYYESYMSEKVVAFVLKDFERLSDCRDPGDWNQPEHFKERVELAATYVFIMELVTFQNTALSKMTTKVSNALAQDGDVSYEYISELYRDYAKSAKFWQNDNFRYLGTQKEAAQIREAFGNDELRQTYREQQEFLEDMVDLKNAQDERKNGNVINVVATILAVVEVHEFFVDLLKDFYRSMNIPVMQAEHSFTALLLCGGMLALIVWYVLERKRRHERRQRMRRAFLRLASSDPDTGRKEDPYEE